MSKEARDVVEDNGVLAVDWVAREEEQGTEKVLGYARGCAQAKGTSWVADWKARATKGEPEA